MAEDVALIAPLFVGRGCAGRVRVLQVPAQMWVEPQWNSHRCLQALRRAALRLPRGALSCKRGELRCNVWCAALQRGALRLRRRCAVRCVPCGMQQCCATMQRMQRNRVLKRRNDATRSRTCNAMAQPPPASRHQCLGHAGGSPPLRLQVRRVPLIRRRGTCAPVSAHACLRHRECSYGIFVSVRRNAG
jgi:hypothetical protein